MTGVAGPSEPDGVVTKENGTAEADTGNKELAAIDQVKLEDTSNSVASGSRIEINNAAIAEEDADAEGDSEAETLIQSPEKKRNIIDSAPALLPTNHSNTKEDDNAITANHSDKENKSRKRKRTTQDVDYQASSRLSTPASSPLSSPNVRAHSYDSDSEASVKSGPRKAKVGRPRRNPIPKAESDDPDNKSAAAKTRKRRPSDPTPPSSKHRQRAQTGSIDAGSSERRETRSATFPRHSSDERSPSPQPNARREHRRGASIQFTPADVERRKRGRPPLINTRRNRSADRAGSASSEDSSSPPPNRTTLQKFNLADHDTMSPAKATGPRKWRDKNGRTFLSRACNNNDLEGARARLAERPEDLNMPDNAGNSPLQIAALEGFVEIVQLLLENNAEVDTRNIDKETPLIDAVENGHLEVVKLLLEFGANPRLGNAKGDEPFELVPADDEHYKEIRKLLADAKERGSVRRPRSRELAEQREGDSSRAASVASPRDSPPITGPRSPPPLPSSRRRTGRSESTRNDLLWQANTQENLTRLAGKGDHQGVASILNILQKAETESLIAAAKAGHEEVLQYLLAMGDGDPDPNPVSTLKSGFNTPMLAAIGRGNLDVVKLLVEHSNFNPYRKFKGKHYYEIAAERKGENWQKEHEILKAAYEKYLATKGRKTNSPKQSRDADRTKSRQIPRSSSPVSSNLRHSTSPVLTQKVLLNKSPESFHGDKRKEGLSPQPQPQKKMGLSRKERDDSVAVSSDHDQTIASKKSQQKVRRSQSDAQRPQNLEAEVTQRRRRLVTGKEHRRRRSAVADTTTSDEGTEIEVKREVAAPGLKRTRNSISPDLDADKEADLARVQVKKRRTILESSPEETRPGSQRMELRQSVTNVDKDVEMKDTDSKPPLDTSEGVFKTHRRTRSGQATIEKESPSTRKSVENDSVKKEKPDEIPVKQSEELIEKIEGKGLDLAEQKQTEAEVERAQREQQEEVARVAEQVRRLEEQRVIDEKAAAERQEQQRMAEEAEAKKKAEEEAANKKREEEEQQEKIRHELEDRQRRQEEKIRQQHLEIERRRRDALPVTLRRCAMMLDAGDSAYKTHQWLSRFLPLFTVRTRQLDPDVTPIAAEEEWVPSFQVACLLATKDLYLRNYTSLEKRPVTLAERVSIWKVSRHMLTYDYESTAANTTIKQAVQKEEEERPKFFAMDELFWVRLSGFEDQVFRLNHLKGLQFKKQPISLRTFDVGAISTPSPKSNGFNIMSPKLMNGLSPATPNGVYGNGQP